MLILEKSINKSLLHFFSKIKQKCSFIDTKQKVLNFSRLISLIRISSRVQLFKIIEKRIIAVIMIIFNFELLKLINLYLSQILIIESKNIEYILKVS